MSRKKRTVKTLAGVVGALLLGACASGCQYPITAGSAWAPGDVAPLGPSFAWMPAPNTPTGNPQIDDPQVRILIRKLVEDQLVAKGYKKASSGRPGFWVGDRVGTETVADPNTLGLEQYTEGTLAIYIVRAQEGQWVWRAWAEARLNESNPPEVKRKRLEQAVGMMFQKFPSKGSNRPAGKR